MRRTGETCARFTVCAAPCCGMAQCATTWPSTTSTIAKSMGASRRSSSGHSSKALSHMSSRRAAGPPQKVSRARPRAMLHTMSNSTATHTPTRLPRRRRTLTLTSKIGSCPTGRTPSRPRRSLQPSRPAGRQPDFSVWRRQQSKVLHRYSRAHLPTSVAPQKHQSWRQYLSTSLPSQKLPAHHLQWRRRHLWSQRALGSWRRSSC
mmetsp:Transcript_1574/g.5106  ORF Transcript_1574/g.5106 Transcript_1574/m.5106 type:complete len:205 (-) Transcript_1574:5545-6159(-)